MTRGWWIALLLVIAAGAVIATSYIVLSRPRVLASEMLERFYRRGEAERARTMEELQVRADEIVPAFRQLLNSPIATEWECFSAALPLVHTGSPDALALIMESINGGNCLTKDGAVRGVVHFIQQNDITLDEVTTQYPDFVTKTCHILNDADEMSDDRVVLHMLMIKILSLDACIDELEQLTDRQDRVGFKARETLAELQGSTDIEVSQP